MPLVPILTAVLPGGEDFVFCSSRYGDGLNLLDCEHAASHLPIGGNPVPYTIKGIRPFTLPWQVQAGECRITVDIAGPGSDTITEINLVPDQVRSTAGVVLDECIGGSPSFGGFATKYITPLMVYVTNPLTNLIGPWPNPRILPLTFFTVTFQYGGDISIESPGDYDEQVPKLVAILLGDKQKHAKDTPLESHYRDGVRQYLGYTVKARTSGYTNKWWSYSQTSTAAAADNMAYECDADLGTPNATDCNQMEQSQLGAASDTITVGPGTPKVLSSSYCNVAVTSTMLIVITWAQVKAALDELIDLCGSNPIGGSVGGKAYYGTMVTPSLGIVGRQVTGLNALPPHVNLTMYSSGHFTP